MHYISLPVLLCLSVATGLVAADPHRHEGSPGDDNIRCIGRWDRRIQDNWHSHWGSAYLRTGFTGTTVKVRLADGAGLLVSVDGEPIRSVSGGGVVDLTPTALKPGDHTLLLAADGQNHEMRFQGLVLDAGAVTLPVPERPLIEFVGDSITACPGKDGNAASNYAWMAAEMLGCDHAQIAFSGVALASGYGFFGDKTGFDIWYFRLKNCNHPDQDAWGFFPVPQLVVVNLGTNDVKDGKRPTNDEFAITYRNFLGQVRAKLPKAELVGIRPFGGFLAGGVLAAVEAMNKAGDLKVHYVDTEGWLTKDDFSDGIHPTVAGHAKAAKRLAAALGPLSTKNP